MTNVTVSSGVSSGGLSFNAGSFEYVYGTAGGTRLVWAAPRSFFPAARPAVPW